MPPASARRTATPAASRHVSATRQWLTKCDVEWSSSPPRQPRSDGAQRQPAEEPPKLSASRAEYHGHEADPEQPIQRVGAGRQAPEEAVSRDRDQQRREEDREPVFDVVTCQRVHESRSPDRGSAARRDRRGPVGSASPSRRRSRGRRSGRPPWPARRERIRSAIDTATVNVPTASSCVAVKWTRGIRRSSSPRSARRRRLQCAWKAFGDSIAPTILIRALAVNDLVNHLPEYTPCNRHLVILTRSLRRRREGARDLW